MIIKHLSSLYHGWLDWTFRSKIVSAIANVILFTIAALVIVNYITNVKQTTEQVGAQLVTLGDQTIIRAAEKLRPPYRKLPGVRLVLSFSIFRVSIRNRWKSSSPIRGD
jgi:hypothetical protein